MEQVKLTRNSAGLYEGKCNGHVIFICNWSHYTGKRDEKWNLAIDGNLLGPFYSKKECVWQAKMICNQ